VRKGGIVGNVMVSWLKAQGHLQGSCMEQKK